MVKNSLVLLAVCVLLVSVPAYSQCDAGDDAALVACSNDQAFDLFDRLNGSPISGGTWLDPADAAFANPFSPTTDIPGIYKYIITQDLLGNPCAVNDTAFLNVTISTVPSVTFNMDNNQSCGLLNTQFTNTTIGPGYTNCTWDFGDGEISTVCNPTHNFTEVACYDIALTLTNGTGCQATDTVVAAACVKQEPVASFELEENPILTTAAQAVFQNRSLHGATYEWIIPGVGNYNEEEPIVDLPPKEETYFVCLEVTGANGCQDTYCSNVLVRDAVVMYIPTAFTPNFDRVNETFKPRLTFTPDIYELTIFDRWGGVVFRSIDPAIGWNGATDVSNFYAPDSYYSYKIKAVKNAEVVERIGQVMILR